MNPRDEVLTKAVTRCPDCQAGVDVEHEEGCDWARRLATGRQRLCCEMFGEDGPGHDCGRDRWAGYFPGSAECVEYGWFVRWDPPPPGQQYGQYTPCGPDDPKAGPDLNRLHRDCRWDAEAGRWVRVA